MLSLSFEIVVKVEKSTIGLKIKAEMELIGSVATWLRTVPPLQSQQYHPLSYSTSEIAIVAAFE
jgi:hypothetical protein